MESNTVVPIVQPHAAVKPQPVLRLDALSRFLDVSKSTIHRLRRDDHTFPKAFLISKQAVGFDLAEIEKWIKGRKASRFQVVAA